MRKEYVHEGSPEQKALDEQTEENQKKWAEAGKGWTDLIYAVYQERRSECVIHRISIRVGWHLGQDSLVTLCADIDGEPMVAFHGAESGERMWSRLSRRMLGAGLTWKADQYARE